VNKKQTVIIITISIFLLLIGGWFYYSYFLSINYLIPGVPYNGIYNLFFQNANSPEISSVMDILGYWGDERFTLADLRQKFLRPATSTIKGFFEENGYETYLWNSFESGGEIKEIKKFVNKDKKTPVIVFQKRSLNSSSIGPRVVIGIFDNEKKVVVHDNLLGNNYKISYQDFEKMFTNNSRAILAVWPSDAIKGLIKGPDYTKPYPARLEAMDKLMPVLISLSEASRYRFEEATIEKSIAAYKEAIENPNFQYFPQAFQVDILSEYANNYIRLKRFDDAIKIINEQILPINKNLSEAPAGWYVLPLDEFARPYFLLSFAFFQKGQKDLAIANYKKYKEKTALTASVVNYPFNPPKIPELEKEISSQ
jgi:tetratricopeptide (TPR) repeat protein